LFNVVKAISLAISLGLSLVPGHQAPSLHRVSATVLSASMAAEQPQVRAVKLDGESVAGWTAAEAALEAEIAAEQAREAAAAAAAEAAAVPVRVLAPNPGAAAVKAMIVQDFSPMGQTAVDWGLRVAACESGYNPNSYNPDGASGVFQFMPGTFRGTPYGSQNIFDAAANVAAAAWYYGRYGGGAWSCK